MIKKIVRPEIPLKIQKVLNLYNLAKICVYFGTELASCMQIHPIWFKLYCYRKFLKHDFFNRKCKKVVVEHKNGRTVYYTQFI